MINSTRNNTSMMGVLSPENISEGEFVQRPAAVNRNGDLTFTIKVLSDFPSNFTQDIFHVTGYQSDLGIWGFEDDTLASNIEREKKLVDFLDSSLIVFNPEKRKSSGGSYIVAKNIQLVGKNFKFDIDEKLIPIPVFSTENDSGLKLTQKEFEERLLGQKIVGSNKQISLDKEDGAEYVIWREEDDFGSFLYGKFEGHLYTYNGIKYLLGEEPLKKWAIEDKWDSEEYDVGDVVFVPQKMLEEQGLLNISEKEIGSSEPVQDSEKDNLIEINEEEEFLKKFQQITRSEEFNLFYDEKDLFNFHTSLKVGSLVILAGLSGTGKSKLVRAYSKAMQLDEGQLNFVSVRPFWEDDSDLLGYPDTINSVYRPGDSGLTDALIEAGKNRDKLYLICFDEMNLARVEHYFSQFLSVLEMDADIRNIRLYNKDLEKRFYNSDQYPATISIGKNVLFVGTVNLDESTYHFSDKVLDRANVISLNILPFTGMYADAPRKNENVPKDRISYDTYSKFRNSKFGHQLQERELDFLWKLHQVITKSNKNIGVGWRIVNQINEYLQNLPNFGPLGRDEAFDSQVVQRVLTKIRGSEEQLSNLLGVYGSPTGEVKESKLIAVFDEFSDVSSFDRSRKDVQEKAKEISLHGYTI
ncbi:McrB family protein [Listeria booriae]|uniref:McrB family protein n=1 Tax=Listeria booriae TaxID=1552123 RepID=UPI001C8A11AB|nr:AAA family ATPase [Listeria booriae]MDT0110090.1 AAA family ATPase [Listeria booriae]